MLERSSVCNAVLGAGANMNIMLYYAITPDYIFTKNLFCSAWFVSSPTCRKLHCKMQ